jgi:hypothetical protein
MSKQRKRETRKLPGADVSGKEDDAPTFCLGSMKVFEALAFDYGLQFLGTLREMTEYAQ